MKFDFLPLARICISIADELADANGFVAVPKLLSRFSAEISVRPLLVEGMLATIDKSTATKANVGWMVLIDSESSRVDEAQIKSETGKQPLPARVRFTVAHE